MAKKKPDRRAERRMAKMYADLIMEGEAGADLETLEFTTRWGLVYQAYIDGLRSAASAPVTHEGT